MDIPMQYTPQVRWALELDATATRTLAAGLRSFAIDAMKRVPRIHV
jgi:hypothetical protein